MNKTIWNLNDTDPRFVLFRIEHTPEAFTEGRRNNDMVNWFIAKRLIDIAAGETEDRGDYDRLITYQHEFKELLIHGLNHVQQESLADWDEPWSFKIDRLVQAYGRLMNPKRLYDLWLPMEYHDGTPEGQTSFADIESVE